MKGFLLLIFMGCFQFALAQKQVATVHQTWISYINQSRLSNKVGLAADVQIRTAKNFVDDVAAWAARAGVNYYLNENTFVSAGYAYFKYLPEENIRRVAMAEHRPWQQFQWTNKYSKLKVTQRLRFEQRFRQKIVNNKLAEGFNFNFRTGYAITVLAPLSKKGFAPGTWAGVLNNELMANFGKEIIYNTFDQNRLFAGFNYQVNKNSVAQLGYMNIFQQFASGNRYRSNHVIRVSYIQNLDWRKKELL